jgi:hypothetical protein
VNEGVPCIFTCMSRSSWLIHIEVEYFYEDVVGENTDGHLSIQSDCIADSLRVQTSPHITTHLPITLSDDVSYSFLRLNL